MRTKDQEKEFRDLAKEIEYEPNDIEPFIVAFNVTKINGISDGKNRNNYANNAMATVGDAMLKVALSEHLFNEGKDRG